MFQDRALPVCDPGQDADRRRDAAAFLKKPVLIVLHQENSNPGHIGQWFVRNGHSLDIRKPRFGDPLPKSLSEHCAAVIFGGPMSANDKDAFVVEETDWISVPLKERKPYLGVCLGAQMLTNHLGGRVAFHPRDKVEIGYYPLDTAPDAGDFGPFPAHVYQWHREGCELPRGMRLLATSRGDFPHQAFAYGSAVGVQFHPEITYAQVHRWTGNNRGRLHMDGAQEREAHIDGHLHHARKVQAWLDGFLTRFTRGDLIQP